MADTLDAIKKIPVMDDEVVEGGREEPQVDEDQKVEQSEEKQSMKKMQAKRVTLILGLGLVVVLAGTGTGYALAQLAPQETTVSTVGEAGLEEISEVSVGTVYGDIPEGVKVDDEQGVLVSGGIEGEGSHHLLRQGGPSKNVYMISTSMDLDMFIDHEVKVWGETYQAQKAGWLMDIVKVEVVELDAEKPFEE